MGWTCREKLTEGSVVVGVAGRVVEVVELDVLVDGGRVVVVVVTGGLVVVVVGGRVVVVVRGSVVVVVDAGGRVVVVVDGGGAMVVVVDGAGGVVVVVVDGGGGSVVVVGGTGPPARAVTFSRFGSEDTPRASITTSVTVNDPALVKVCVGVGSLLSVPSPKSHRDVIKSPSASVELLVKLTVSGAGPLA